MMTENEDNPEYFISLVSTFVPAENKMPLHEWSYALKDDIFYMIDERLKMHNKNPWTQEF